MFIPRKILIIRFSSMGDIILASPLVRALRTAFPAAQIDFLTKAIYTDLVRFNPSLTSIIAFHNSGKTEWKALRDRIRHERYDLIVDIHNSLRSRTLRWRARARRVAVARKYAVRRFALVNLKRNYYKDVVPVAERYLAAVRRFGVRNDGLGLEFFVPEDSTASARAIMEQMRLKRYACVIGIAPVAQHFTKRWLPDRFVELAGLLTARGNTKVLIFGGKEDAVFCGDLAQMINAKQGASVADSLAGTMSLLETAAAFDSCHLVISNDTGLMHLAAARQRKVVTIFGSSVREFGFAPYGTENRIVEVQGLECRPCSHIGRDSCPEGHFRCMKEITAHTVLADVEELLRAHST
jgi:lipopolysaccharide heptosyltransferase II